MSQDWYRNTRWDAAIEAEFFRRLARSRDKTQYLRLQAHELRHTHPDVALRLLDAYFARGEPFDMAQAFFDRAEAHAALGDIDAALGACRDALAREAVFPNVKTQAYLEFALLAEAGGRADLWTEALAVLAANEGSPRFPKDRYRFHGVRALLLDRSGRQAEALAAVALALGAAAEQHSGFANHPGLGLVEGTGDAFGRRVARLAGD